MSIELQPHSYPLLDCCTPFMCISRIVMYNLGICILKMHAFLCVADWTYLDSWRKLPWGWPTGTAVPKEMTVENCRNAWMCQDVRIAWLIHPEHKPNPEIRASEYIQLSFWTAWHQTMLQRPCREHIDPRRDITCKANCCGYFIKVETRVGEAGCTLGR